MSTEFLGKKTDRIGYFCGFISKEMHVCDKYNKKKKKLRQFRRLGKASFRRLCAAVEPLAPLF